MKITHKSIEDEKGILYPLSLSEIPFDVKRIFQITNVPMGTIRGGHAHKECLQYFVCTKGKIEIHLNCDKPFILKQGQGVFVDKGVYAKEKYLTGKDVLTVFCSHEYDKNDYIK